MDLTDPCLYNSDEDLARALLDTDNLGLNEIMLEKLKEKGWIRLNLPEPYLPFANGFPTPSGKLAFASQAAADAGSDPLPTYIPPAEVSDRALARRYPLQKASITISAS